MDSGLPPIATLFAGTAIQPGLQRPIYSDIQSMRQFFPEISAFCYYDGQKAVVLLQGSISIEFNGADCAMPINMKLPDNFPFSPPIASIPVPQGFPLRLSNGLRQNGMINSEAFIKWIPRNTTLPVFVGAISNYFSSNPPFNNIADAKMIRIPRPQQAAAQMPTYQQPAQIYGSQSIPNAGAYQQSNFQRPVQPTGCYQMPGLANSQQLINQGIAQAQSIIDEANNNIKKAHQAEVELKQNEVYVATVQSVSKELALINSDLNEQVRQAHINAETIPEYQIPEALSQAAKAKASLEVHEQMCEELKDLFRYQKISIDQLVKQTRILNRDYFEQTIYPRLA